MLRRSIVLLIALTLGLCACGDEATVETDPQGEGSGDSKPKATRPAFTVDDAKRMANTDVEGFKRYNTPIEKLAARWRYESEETTAGGATMVINVMVDTCESPSLCYALDPQDRMNTIFLKQAKEALVKRKMQDPVVTLEPVELEGGRVGLAFYRRGYAEFEHKPGLMSRESTHALQFRFHDGANGITIDVYPRKSGSLSTREEFEARASQDEVFQAAHRVFRALADNFGNG